jgi:hypothetical protein
MAEPKLKTWDKLVDLWRENIRKNLAKISATIGQMIISLFALIMLIMKEGYDIVTGLILLAISMQPFFNWWINLIFKGESELKDHEINMLSQKLEYAQVLNEYRVLLAAKDGKIPDTVIAVHDWNELNRKIEELNQKIEAKEPTIYTDGSSDTYFPEGTDTGT